MTEEQKKGFGARLQELRLAREMTQQDLSDRSGVKLASVHAYEHGRRSPTLVAGVALADALGVHPRALLQPAGAPAGKRKF